MTQSSSSGGSVFALKTFFDARGPRVILNPNRTGTCTAPCTFLERVIAWIPGGCSAQERADNLAVKTTLAEQMELAFGKPTAQQALSAVGIKLTDKQAHRSLSERHIEKAIGQAQILRQAHIRETFATMNRLAVFSRPFEAMIHEHYKVLPAGSPDYQAFHTAFHDAVKADPDFGKKVLDEATLRTIARNAVIAHAKQLRNTQRQDAQRQDVKATSAGLFVPDRPDRPDRPHRQVFEKRPPDPSLSHPRLDAGRQTPYNTGTDRREITGART